MYIHKHCAQRAHIHPTTDINPNCWQYILQYQYIYSTGIYLPSSWQYISNTNIYVIKCTYPKPAHKGRTGTLQLALTPNCWQHISNTNVYIQLSYIPELLALFIQYKYIVH